jgi:hypothetical protein
MASIYYPYSASVYVRSVGANQLSELHINTTPDTIFILTGSLPYTNSIVFIQSVDTASTYPITASWVQTASVVIQYPSSITASGGITSNTYQLLSNYSNFYSTSYSVTQADDGKFITVNSGSTVTVTLTSSVSPTFNAMFYQSGSGGILFVAGSNTVLRSRSSSTGSAGRYSLATVVRAPNGDFILGGDVV